jgi:hypothetical protein
MFGPLAYYFYFAAPASTTATVVGSGGVRVGGAARIAVHATAAAGAGKYQWRGERLQRGYAKRAAGGVTIGGAAAIRHQQPDDVCSAIGRGSLGHFGGAATVVTGRTAHMIFLERDDEDLLALTA